MADNEKFKYDPEAGKDVKPLRLPFALCKSKGIDIKDWWTPRDAWRALKAGGQVNDVGEEYEKYYRELKKKRAKEYREKYPERVLQSRLRSQTKKRQLASEEHTPEKDYQHKEGTIANAPKGKPMTFEQADGGNCNPYYGKFDEKTGIEYIGYHTNCQTCVATYIARRQGYDVRALPNVDNIDILQLSYNTSLAFRDKNGNHPQKKNAPYGRTEDFLSMEVKQGEIHSMEFSWRAKKGVGHIVTVEKDEQGRLKIYDPQTSDIIQGEGEIRAYLRRVSQVRTMNLTECTLDESFCDKIMKGSKKQ